MGKEWQTKFGPLNEQTVKEAFEATGLKPDSIRWFSKDENCGCALGAFLQHKAPGTFDRLWGLDGRFGEEIMIESLDLKEHEVNEISEWFHSQYLGRGEKWHNV